MNNLKLSMLLMCAFSSNVFANNTTANFETNATLNGSCSIKNSINNVEINFNPSDLQQGVLNGGGTTNVAFQCTNNTSVNISLSPNTQYQAGDDPYTMLASNGITPRGVLVGSNAENKLAYSTYFTNVTSSPPDTILIPLNSANFSYTTKFSNQNITINISNKVNSNKLLPPDNYKDTITVNITY